MPFIERGGARSSDLPQVEGVGMSRLLVFLALLFPHAGLVAADTRIIMLDEALSRAEVQSPAAQRIQRQVDVARA